MLTQTTVTVVGPTPPEEMAVEPAALADMPMKFEEEPWRLDVPPVVLESDGYGGLVDDHFSVGVDMTSGFVNDFVIAEPLRFNNHVPFLPRPEQQLEEHEHAGAGQQQQQQPAPPEPRPELEPPPIGDLVEELGQGAGLKRELSMDEVAGLVDEDWNAPPPKKHDAHDHQ
jgi:hypothetical protein